MASRVLDMRAQIDAANAGEKMWTAVLSCKKLQILKQCEIFWDTVVERWRNRLHQHHLVWNTCASRQEKQIGLGSMDSRLNLLGKLNVNNATLNMHWSTHIHSFTATEQETRRTMPCSWLTLKCTSYEVLSNLLNQTEISAEGTSQALWQIPAGGL